MKILADTNIFVKFWKTNAGEIGEVFAQEEIVICGPVRAELMHGARTDKEMKRILNMLDIFEELAMNEKDWMKVGKNLYRLRINGVNLPFADAVIASVALKYDIPLWTNDRHFTHIQGVIPELKLY